LVCLAAAGLIASTCSAQTASLRWEVRPPGGQWQSGIVATTAQQTLDIRLVASWDVPDSTGAASLYMDALVKNAGFDDQVLNPVRVAPFNARPQTIAARRVMQGIKIDDSADLGEAGANTSSLILLQIRSEISGTTYSTSNPVTLFTFQLQVGSEAGLRRVTCAWPSHVTNDPTHRNLRVYTSPQGANVQPYTQPCDLTIYVGGGPGPGTCYFADFNRDGVVDLFDYLDFAAAFAAEMPSADVNYDCEIDLFDYLDFVATFSQC
jgi:hypothetical protein